MATYILNHTHRFGMDSHLFQSDRSLAGHYESKGVGGEKMSEEDDLLMNDLNNLLGTDIDLDDEPETVDILDINLTQIPVL